MDFIEQPKMGINSVLVLIAFSAILLTLYFINPNECDIRY